jgi:hypothetical protein
MRLSVVGVNPVMVSVTTMFHLALVLTPFFVLGHNVLLDLAWHVSLPSLPEAVADGLDDRGHCRRGFLPPAPHLLWHACAPFQQPTIMWCCSSPPPRLSPAFLAYHHFFDYDTVILLHILAGEIMLMAVPFTKLVHMPYFFINRFVLVHENTLGAGGSRTWR